MQLLVEVVGVLVRRTLCPVRLPLLLPTVPHHVPTAHSVHGQGRGSRQPTTPPPMPHGARGPRPNTAAAARAARW